MEVEFRNKAVKSRYDDLRKANRKWGQPIGERYIRVVTLIMSVQDLNDLYDVPSIKFHQLTGDRQGQYSLRLNSRMQLIIEHDATRSSVVVAEVSKHYGD